MAGLAHYAKNIIQGMRFSMATLKVAVERNKLEHVPDYVESVLSQERRMSELVMDMLSYSKDRTPHRAPVDMRALLEEITAPYRNELKDLDAELHVNTAPDCPPVLADEQALHRVFLNLLSNAIDALGDVREEREKKITVDVAHAAGGKAVEVRFRDTGIGMQPDKLSRIFDVFYSTKGSEGTGLGLAVVGKIVQEHGGEISVDSREGEWTEFKVCLPCVGAGGSEGEQ